MISPCRLWLPADPAFFSDSMKRPASIHSPHIHNEKYNIPFHFPEVMEDFESGTPSQYSEPTVLPAMILFSEKSLLAGCDSSNDSSYLYYAKYCIYVPLHWLHVLYLAYILNEDVNIPVIFLSVFKTVLPDFLFPEESLHKDTDPLQSDK